MPTRHVVVDGSNIATEGRSLPSLAQLDQAVKEFLMENPDDVVTVVVDASFGHRIDASELPTFEEAEAAGEVVSPPAGAIGRGDAFLLRIAEKTGATVLSNDSFQEFHGEHEWLFERGRLIGGKPVPGVGWIFTPRTPVRGPKSREAVKEAKRRRQGDASVSSDLPGLDLAAERARGGRRKKTVERAIAVATEEAVEPSHGGRRRRRRNAVPPAVPLNEPLAFITFIAEHPLGSEVQGTIDTFASHGAFVEVAGARCYIPLSAMGDPPPRSARELLSKGQEATFVVQALDPLRRGVELALPGFARPAGEPTAETVEAEIGGAAEDEPETAAAAEAPRRGRRRAPAGERAVPESGAPSGAEPAPGRATGAGPDTTVSPPRRRRAAGAARTAAAETSPQVVPPAPGESGEAPGPGGKQPARAGRKRVATPAGAEAPTGPSAPAGAAGEELVAGRPKRASRAGVKAAAGGETGRQEPAGAPAAPAKRAPARKARARATGEGISPAAAGPEAGAQAAAPAQEAATPVRKRPAARKAPTMAGGDSAGTPGEGPAEAAGAAAAKAASRRTATTRKAAGAPAGEAEEPAGRAPQPVAKRGRAGRGTTPAAPQVEEPGAAPRQGSRASTARRTGAAAAKSAGAAGAEAATPTRRRRAGAAAAAAGAVVEPPGAAVPAPEPITPRRGRTRSATPVDGTADQPGTEGSGEASASASAEVGAGPRRAAAARRGGTTRTSRAATVGTTPEQG